MTRDEAIALFTKHMPDVRRVGAVIDFYTEAGMLKLDEPKNPEMRAGEIIAAYTTGADTAAILMELSDAGLKIVAAQP